MGCGQSSPMDSPKRRGSFSLDNSGRVEDFYDLDLDNAASKLGQGSYGAVLKADNLQTRSAIAVKVVKKEKLSKWSRERLTQEIAIMKTLDHPNIVKMYEVFEDMVTVYLILELCSVCLFDRIIAVGHLSEGQAAYMMLQIFRALNYLHENHVCHRDMKPENCLLARDGLPVEESPLKVIDFGFSSHFEPGKPLKGRMGTLYYLAPELLQGVSGPEPDLWAAGVIVYIMLCGFPPFHGKTEADVMKRIEDGKISFEYDEWNDTSANAIDLIKNLLCRSTHKRYTAEAALNHAWIQDVLEHRSTVDLPPRAIKNLRRYQGLGRLKRLAVQIIASRLRDESVTKLREAFIALDRNGDGSLTVDEVSEGLQNSGLGKSLPPGDLRQILASLPSDDTGRIVYTDFIAATLDRKLYLREDACWSAFCVFDRDSDGKITKDELLSVFQQSGHLMKAQDVELLIREVDTDKNGSISFQEFMTMMTAPPERNPHKKSMADVKSMTALGSKSLKSQKNSRSMSSLSSYDSESDGCMEEARVDDFDAQAVVLDNGAYVVGRQLGNGLYAVRHEKTGRELCGRFGDSLRETISREVKLLRYLQGGLGIPRVHFYVEDCAPGKAIVVMDCLGPSLGNLQRMRLEGRRVDAARALDFIDQLLQRLEYIHAQRIVHRCITDATLCVGVGKLREDVVFLTDFRQGKQLGRSAKHGPRAGKSFRGSFHFASLRCHEGVEAGFRDDAESALYVAASLLAGRLPWSAEATATACRAEKEQKVREVKERPCVLTELEVMPEGPEAPETPVPLSQLDICVALCRELEFDEVPDYSRLRSNISGISVALQLPMRSPAKCISERSSNAVLPRVAAGFGVSPRDSPAEVDEEKRLSAVKPDTAKPDTVSVAGAKPLSQRGQSNMSVANEGDRGMLQPSNVRNPAAHSRGCK